MISKLITGLLLLIISNTINAKNYQAGDPVEIIKRSMQKSGDYESVKTIKLKNVRKNYNKWQNYNFQNPKPTNDESYREIDFEKKQVYFKTTSRYGGGYLFEFVAAGSDSVIYNYDVNKSRNGNKLSKGDKKVLESNILSLSTYLPYYNLQAILKSGDSLTSHAEASGPVVTRHLKNGTKQEYFFSKENDQLIKISNIQPGQVTTTFFKDYIIKNNILYPKKDRSRH